MPQLLFEPVVNKIGEDSYLVSPKNDKTDVRCVMKCNGIAVDIICNMYPERCSQEKNAEMIAEKYGITYDEAFETVNGVIAELRKHNSNSGGESNGET